MKRDNKAAASLNSSAAGGEINEPPAASVERAASKQFGQQAVMEEHRTLMSRGELIFCLQHVHSYWSTPRISYHEMEQLEQQNLIQRSVTSICAIRLTEQGKLVKNRRQLKTP